MNSKKILFDTIFYIITALSAIYGLACLFCIEKPYNFVYFLAFLVPIVLFFVLKKLCEKYDWIDLFATFCAIIIAIIMCVIFLVFGFILYIDHKVPRLFYKIELNSLKKQYGEDRFSHFPDRIPFNAKNYYFHVEHAWDNSVDVLYFDTNESYISTVKNKFRNKCIVYGKKSEIFSQFLFPHIAKADDNDMLCLFNLPSGEERYLRGFLTGKSRIYFFYEIW